MRLHLISLVAAGAAVFLSRGESAPPPVVPNDNRTPAGLLAHDTLAVELVLDRATWFPQGSTGPSVEVAAFAETGGPPQVPAPLIRVASGTVIRATVTNALDSAYVIRGFSTRPGTTADSIVLQEGERRTIIFPAGAPGTYFYDAVPAGYAPPSGGPGQRKAEREHAAGALVIDPPEGSSPDRILVINIRGDRTDSGYRNALTINGLSWPHTERFDALTGDTVRWRVINASSRSHPMHMHGFYFSVDARGSRAADVPFSPSERRLMVTETMGAYSTMAITWIASRPGNWLFHCHLAFHVAPSSRLDAATGGDHDAHAGMSHKVEEHMAGLIVGMRVRARPGDREEARTGVRQRRIFVQEGPRRGRSPRALGYVMQQGSAPPAPDSVEIPGTPLILERGVPYDVEVINRLDEPVAIHWHGLELESWSDGVAGWSGLDTTVAPAVEPKGSFVARLTVPRSGTFIYHTHMNDIEQLTSGLYGALVVVEPGERFDPSTDHVAVIGWDGDAVGGQVQILVNGDSVTRPLEVRANQPHRLRFVNIGPAGITRLELRRDSALVEWRRLALDGAALPPAQAIVVPAAHRIDVGQTADFEIRLAPGRYALTYYQNPVTPVITQVIVAR